MAPLQAALERMQTKAGDIHPFRAGTAVEGCKDAEEFGDAPPRNLGGSSLLIGFSQAAMPKRPDHRPSVWCLSTIVN